MQFGTSCDTLYDLDIPGNNIQGAITGVMNHQTCCQKCLENAACKAWTWAPWNSCWIKSVFSGTSSYVGLVSGTRDNATTCVDFVGYDFLTGNLPNQPLLFITSATQCCNNCQSTYSCLGWTYYSAVQKCWLKSVVPSPTGDLRLVSGLVFTDTITHVYVLSSTYLQAQILFNVTVSWPTFSYGTTPAGTVTLTKAGTQLGVVTLVNGKGTLTFNSNSAFVPGTHTLVATHTSSNSLSNSAATFTVTIPKVTPTLNIERISGYEELSTRFNISIAPTIASTPATGIVSLFGQLNGFLTNATLANGYVVITSSIIYAGTQNFTAVYSGDANYASATQVLNEVLILSYAANIGATIVGVKPGAPGTVLASLRYDCNCLSYSYLFLNIFEVGATTECPSNEWFACGFTFANKTYYTNGTVVVTGLELKRQGLAPPTAQGVLATISLSTQCQTEAAFGPANSIVQLLAIAAPPPTSVTASASGSASISVTWTPAADVVQHGWILSYTLNSVLTTSYVTNNGVYSTTVSGLTTGATYTFQMSSVSFINGTSTTSSNSVTL